METGLMRLCKWSKKVSSYKQRGPRWHAAKRSISSEPALLNTFLVMVDDKNNGQNLIIYASSRETLFSGIVTKQCSNQLTQHQSQEQWYVAS